MTVRLGCSYRNTSDERVALKARAQRLTAPLRREMSAAEPSMLKPDLIIADYRLESGRTGTEAIRALRGMLDQPIPAIVLTGSVLSNHEREAQESILHLLLKPVVPSRLRAMIAFTLGLR